MLLSACLIAKNEELTLERCLRSLQGVADEVILVDTGSTDRTVEIARANGARVFHFDWVNDFAAARNESLKHAQGDWILVIDADEYLDARQGEGFRTFLQSTDAEGVFVTSRNYLGSLQQISSIMPIRVMRVFRRGHVYTGAIHEQVADSVTRTGRPVATFALNLHHVGYTNEFVARKSKTERNTELIEAELAQDPNNLFQRSNLIAEYILQKNYTACEGLAERTWLDIKRTPVKEWPNFTPRILQHLIVALWEQGKREAALERSREGIRYFGWLTDMKKRHANMLAMSGRLTEAEALLQECRKQGDTKDGLIEFAEGMGSYLAAADLGATWALLGDDLQARQWYLQAFLENPTLDGVVIPLTFLMPPVADFLHEHIESKIIDAVTSGNYTESYAIRGLPHALDVVERAEGAYGKNELTERARASLKRQEGTEALREYCEQQGTENHWFWLGLHLLDSDRAEEAVEVFRKAGTRGEYMVKAHELFTQTANSQWGIRLITRDLVAMHTENLLRKWLPFATDRQEAWIYVKYSPLGHVLSEIEWAGETVHECEQNALRLFQQKRFAEAEFWLESARTFQPTVTQVLLGCDLALAQGKMELARKIAYEGKLKFPASDFVKMVSEQVHPKIDSVQLYQELANAEGTRGGRLS